MPSPNESTSPKSILVLGAYGFIGSALTASLISAGHKVTGFGRNLTYGRSLFPDMKWIQGDLKDYCTVAAWEQVLADIDIIINASGILQSGPSDNVNVTQFDAIAALAAAADKANISQIIQISAAGASLDAPHDFMRSKAAADAKLLAAKTPALVLRPGLVIGRNSYGGTELIRMIAAMPLMSPVPAGAGTMQTIALSDIVKAVQNAVHASEAQNAIHDLVAPQKHSLHDIITAHRRWMGFAPARFAIPIAAPLIKLSAWVSDALGWLGWRSPLRSNAVTSLMQGVAGNTGECEKLLGRPALSLPRQLAAMPAGKQDRIHARLMLMFVPALLALILLWLGSGILGFVKTEEAAALLSQSGLSQATAKILVWGGAAADIILGVGLMLRKTVRAALAGTIMLTLAYLTSAVYFTPELWLDPLAPMLKALTSLGLSAACIIALDKR